MSLVTPEDELLIVLLRNLRNVVYTFGESSKQHMSMRALIQEHLEDMRRKGLATNLTQARLQELRMQVGQSSSSTASQQPDDLPELMEALARIKLQ